MGTKPVVSRFAENLLIARRRAGLSQEEFGYRAGLHRTEISELELGHREPKISTLLKLSGALGLTPNDLLAGVEWRPRPAAPLLGEFSVRD